MYIIIITIIKNKLRKFLPFLKLLHENVLKKTKIVLVLDSSEISSTHCYMITNIVL